MKRILTAILCAGILAVTAVGCSYNDALYKDGNSSSQTSEDSTQPTTSSPLLSVILTVAKPSFLSTNIV